ncbi:hypothetical protein [Spiroplasma endosymbiont of Phycita roborella]|uniref:hypothetical protein n=1 Tax=Spiroplasma endosymbiont of Phycita roborella TaxID=3066311 RepID=UPI00313DAFBB
MTTLTITANDADQTLINYLKKVFKTLPLSKIYRLFRKKKSELIIKLLLILNIAYKKMI